MLGEIVIHDEELVHVSERPPRTQEDVGTLIKKAAHNKPVQNKDQYDWRNAQFESLSTDRVAQKVLTD
jgi:hypothetical protein